MYLLNQKSSKTLWGKKERQGNAKGVQQEGLDSRAHQEARLQTAIPAKAVHVFLQFEQNVLYILENYFNILELNFLMYNNKCIKLSVIIFIIKEDETHLFNENDKILHYTDVKVLQKLSATEQALMKQTLISIQCRIKYYY